VVRPRGTLLVAQGTSLAASSSNNTVWKKMARYHWPIGATEGPEEPRVFRFPWSGESAVLDDAGNGKKLAPLCPSASCRPRNSPMAIPYADLRRLCHVVPTGAHSPRAKTPSERGKFDPLWAVSLNSGWFDTAALKRYVRSSQAMSTSFIGAPVTEPQSSCCQAHGRHFTACNADPRW
jgi:hypothetical protein